MSKNKKILFTILIIIVIVVLGLIAYQYSGDKPETKVQEGVETEGDKAEKNAVTEENTVTGEDDEEDVGYVPPTDQSPAEITSIVDEAIRNLDMSLCEDIKDMVRASECRQDINLLK